jgi:hypothetical protein
MPPKIDDLENAHTSKELRVNMSFEDLAQLFEVKAEQFSGFIEIGHHDESATEDSSPFPLYTSGIMYVPNGDETFLIGDRNVPLQEIVACLGNSFNRCVLVKYLGNDSIIRPNTLIFFNDNEDLVEIIEVWDPTQPCEEQNTIWEVNSSNKMQVRNGLNITSMKYKPIHGFINTRLLLNEETQSYLQSNLICHIQLAPDFKTNNNSRAHMGNFLRYFRHKNGKFGNT